MKRIRQTSLSGQLGVNLIEQIVLKMGYVWYPTGGMEAGIDGYIELRDAHTGDVFNLVLQVQSKVVSGTFTAETPTSFDYLCNARDLDYWLQGNAPVILVVSRPMQEEAYWISVKDYFRDLAVRKTRKVHFHKERNRFDVSVKEDLLAIALPESAGIYLAPPPRQETLWSNLLPVTSFAKRLYVADTEFRRPGDLVTALQEQGGPGGEWILKDKRIISFHDLREDPWRRICDPGTCDDFDTEEWATTQDLDRRREFVWLLNQTLRQKVRRDLRYTRDKDCYHFMVPREGTKRTFSYRNLANMAQRAVVQAYPDKRRPGQIAYYRHSAFEGRFLSFDGDWFLEIVPTYYFTVDGWKLHPLHGNLLKGLKQLERNPNVLSQVIMWANYLAPPPDLFNPAYQFLTFGKLLPFTVDAGIDDARWLRQEDESNMPIDDATNDATSLFERWT